MPGEIPEMNNQVDELYRNNLFLDDPVPQASLKRLHWQ